MSALRLIHRRDRRQESGVLLGRSQRLWRHIFEGCQRQPILAHRMLRAHQRLIRSQVVWVLLDDLLIQTSRLVIALRLQQQFREGQLLLRLHAFAILRKRQLQSLGKNAFAASLITRAGVSTGQRAQVLRIACQRRSHS